MQDTKKARASVRASLSQSATLLIDCRQEASQLTDVPFGLTSRVITPSTLRRQGNQRLESARAPEEAVAGHPEGRPLSRSTEPPRAARSALWSRAGALLRLHSDHAAALGVLGLARDVRERGELGGVVSGRGLATILLIRVVDLASVLEPALVDPVHVGVVVEESGVIVAPRGQHRSGDPDVALVVHAGLSLRDPRGPTFVIRPPQPSST
eukprot:scaffold3536_cov64-Phaeocystis_antarctica.AAC.2